MRGWAMLGLLHSLVLPGVLPLWLLCVRIGSMELLCDVRAQWVMVLLWVEHLPDEQPQELGNPGYTGATLAESLQLEPDADPCD